MRRGNSNAGGMAQICGRNLGSRRARRLAPLVSEPLRGVHFRGIKAQYIDKKEESSGYAHLTLCLSAAFVSADIVLKVVP